jgi:hypothetical protein
VEAGTTGAGQTLGGAGENVLHNEREYSRVRGERQGQIFRDWFYFMEFLQNRLFTQFLAKKH